MSVDSCKSTLDLHGDCAQRVDCVLGKGHPGPHQGTWTGGSRADNEGATCPNCHGKGYLEAYVMNGPVAIQWLSR